MRKNAKWQHSPTHYLGDDLAKLDLGAARVLLAGPLARARLSPILRDDGYDVIETPVAYDILRFVRTREVADCDPVDVIVIDVSRHPRRGLKLVEAIRMTDWSLPVIAICGRQPQSVIDELRRLGVTIFRTTTNVEKLRTAVVNTMPPFAATAAA